MSKGATGKVVLREEYAPYPWTLDRASFHFDIGDEVTRVRSALPFRRNPASADAEDLILNGQAMELQSVHLDGRALAADEFRCTEDHLVILGAPDSGLLEIEVTIRPWQNTALEGLYGSGQFLLTQCEAEGFRKIT